MKEKILTKHQWLIIIIGIVLVILGFFLMSGGRQNNPNEFNYNEIFHPRRITLAPITLTIGYVLIAIGLVWKKKHSQ